MAITVVQKYGGACLESADRVRAVAKSLAARHARGERLVVVVSAMGKTTDDLVRLAYQVSPHPNRRELDMLLTTGERVSMALLSMALSDLGVPAISFTGSQAGVLTDDSHSSARIVDVRPVRVREELERGRIVVLAGFQGVNPATKEITTLGRGGSDTTAVALAGALKADACEIVKEVDGVCSADPRLVPSAHSLSQVNYLSLAEMCFWGAKVLHFRSVELALRQNVPLIIRKWGTDSTQTNVVKEAESMEKSQILSVNTLARVEQLHTKVQDLNQGLERLARALKQGALAWPQILASDFANGECRITISGDPEFLDTLIRTLKPSQEWHILAPASAAVTLTCWGGVSSDLPYRALQMLTHQGIQAERTLLSPHSITFFVGTDQREGAVRALHTMI